MLLIISFDCNANDMTFSHDVHANAHFSHIHAVNLYIEVQQSTSGSDVIKLLSCSTQMSMKFQLLRITKMLKGFFFFFFAFF